METTDGNIALGKTAFMSSVYGSLSASLAVDGNVATHFHTKDKDKESSWWAVDFGAARTRVTRVRVVNINDVHWGK